LSSSPLNTIIWQSQSLAPPQEQVISSSELIVYQKSQAVSYIMLFKEASLGLSQICVEEGRVPCFNNLAGRLVKKHPVVV